MAVHREYQTINNQPVKVPYFDIACPHCGGHKVIKYGHYRGVQRFYCKTCKRKFTDNDALPYMKTPKNIVSCALSCYFGNVPVGNVNNQ